jgi:hypothetical protein
MKRIDMSQTLVVYTGENWTRSLPPCSKELMCLLERNERIVSWLQPLKGGVHDQIPAIKVGDSFYSISLRMMKAIWRHVRLKKGFENVERAPYGGYKLKIPTLLLAEKLRTQSRFNVSVVVSVVVCCMCHASVLLFIYIFFWVAGDAHGPNLPPQGAQGLPERLL